MLIVIVIVLHCVKNCTFLYLVQEKVDLLTEKLESTGTLDSTEKPGDVTGGDGGTTGAPKTNVGKKTCMFGMVQ